MTYSHSRVSSFSSVSASPSTLLTSSPSLVPAAAPLLQPSFSTASEVDILVDMSQQDKLNLFSLTISSPPPMLMMNNSNDPENIPPLSIADDEEEAFQIHLQHEMQKGSTVSSTSCSSCFSRLCTSHSSLRIQFFSLFFCLLFFLFSLFLVFLSSSNRCTMDTNLRRMFLDVTDALKAHNIEYFLDSGTLLGAVRDGKIIPWEFDLDLGMVESECEKLPRLKEYFSARGYELFVRNDFIPYKENKLMGYDGYLHAPCGRLYDQQAEYYTDIYWFQVVNKERRQRIQHNQHQKAMGLPLVLSDSPLASPLSKNPPRGHGPSYDSFDIDSYITTPWNYSPSLNGDEDWICTAEGFDPTGMPGGCNLKSDILPNRKMSFLGGTHGIPNKPESVLKGVYGDWQTPSAKGYKALFCSALPPMWVSATFAIATGVLATACIMQLYCLVVCGRRELWSTLLKEMKRRLDEYYA